jgi:hypothetical protein
MSTIRVRFLLVAITVLVLAACGPGAVTSTTTTQATTTTAPSTTSTTEPTTTTSEPSGAPVLPVALEEMPSTWELVFHIPYGETPETLGTHLGGDGEGIQFGPEYGSQGPDGSWWFLDVANFRLARFSESGEYMSEIVIPESLLVNGIYFQYQLPRTLSDGTFLASRLDGARTTFLRVRGNDLSTFSVPYEMSPRTDDGSILYGFSYDEDSASLAVDPTTGTAGPVEWFVTRAGTRFRVAGGAAGLVIELPDSAGETMVQLEFEAAEVGGSVYTGLEVVSDIDGTLHIFLLGFPERDEALQLAGYLTVTADGEVSAVEPIRNPFTDADPGSPARLGVRPGTTEVTFMIIDTDGVKVYRHR